jgi:hypothetical protein
MKKREVVLYVLLFVIFSLSISFSYALSYPADCPWAVEGVCGQCPDSLLGYGQVMVWGKVYSCNNVADGVCPEDYQDINDGSLYGDCSSCTDRDCTGTISGKVITVQGAPIDKATIMSNPIKWNLSAPPLQNSTLTNSLGIYSMEVVTGKYFFSASKNSYDTQLIEARVWRNINTEINFTLLNGTCHDDCTNSYNRCNAICEGLLFNNDTSSCHFNNTKIQTLCNNRIAGTLVFYDSYNSTHAYFVDCCEGVPTLKYYSKLSINPGKIRDLVNIEKIAKYNDVPVKVIISYWSPIN